MSRPERNRLAVFLLVYLGASFLHFTHNAEFVNDYPNLPTWLTRSQVYLAWIGLTAIGVAGFVFYSRSRQAAGLFLMGLYAALGFDGLLHYSRAPADEHTFTMNFTIWFEVVAAAVLLVAVVFAALRRLRDHVLEA